MKLEIHYYNLLRKVTGKSSETMDFVQSLTVKQWLELFIIQYKDGISNTFEETSAESIFERTRLFINQQAVFSLQEVLDKDAKLDFFVAVVGG